MEKIVVESFQAPGDYIVLSAALRDVQVCYPGRFELWAHTLQDAVFQCNPLVHAGDTGGVRHLRAEYGQAGIPHSIKTSNQARTHFMWSFIGDLNHKLKLNTVLTDFKPALYLNEMEMAKPPHNFGKPYWVFLSGGKKDYTAKVWAYTWWQELVDRLKDQVVMVQVGGGSHYHPPINGAYDLVKKTSFREFMRLIYHAHGVFSIVTCAMHIAAAFNKPCVTIAGGREPWWWEAYTEENRLFNMWVGKPDWKPPEHDNFIPHRYLHTIDQLPCCMNKGCWKRYAGSKDIRNCVKEVIHCGQPIPRCLEMITPNMVIENWKWYYDNGILSLGDKKAVIVPAPMPALPLPPPVLEVVAPKTSCLFCGYMPPTAQDKPRFAVEVLEALSGRREDITFYCDGPDTSFVHFCGINNLPAYVGAGEGRLGAFAKIAPAAGQDWLIWFEYPYRPGPDFLKILEGQLTGEPMTGGIIYWKPVPSDIEACCKNGKRLFYPGNGLIVAHRSVLKELKWETAQTVVNLESWIGAISLRQGRKLVDLSRHLVRI